MENLLISTPASVDNFAIYGRSGELLTSYQQVLHKLSTGKEAGKSCKWRTDLGLR